MEGCEVVKEDFNIMNYLSVESLKSANQDRKKIHYKKLIGHEKNHYAMDNIKELADTIENFGILQDLSVKPLDNGMYSIVAGHRRHEAVKMLVEERGLTKFEFVDCVLTDPDENETITQIKLHITNTTARELSDYDKMVAISELKRLFNEAREQGIEIKGKLRELIAKEIGLGTTQVQKYLSIAENASEDIIQGIKEESITIEDAYKTVKNKKTEENRREQVSANDTLKKEVEDRPINVEDEKNLNQAFEVFQEFKKIGNEIENPILHSLIGKLEKHLNKLVKIKKS